MARKEIKKVNMLFYFKYKLRVRPVLRMILLYVYCFTAVKQLQIEVAALEELSRQLFLEAHDIQNARERLEWAATWQGKYFNFLGYFFSLYCTWKIFIVGEKSVNDSTEISSCRRKSMIFTFCLQSTINIVFDRVGKKDPVTRGIEIAVHWIGFNIDVTFWSQHISFYLVGCIVVTSIRGLLLTLTKVR